MHAIAIFGTSFQGCQCSRFLISCVRVCLHSHLFIISRVILSNQRHGPQQHRIVNGDRTVDIMTTMEINFKIHFVRIESVEMEYLCLNFSGNGLHSSVQFGSERRKCREFVENFKIDFKCKRIFLFE